MKTNRIVVIVALAFVAGIGAAGVAFWKFGPAMALSAEDHRDEHAEGHDHDDEGHAEDDEEGHDDDDETQAGHDEEADGHEGGGHEDEGIVRLSADEVEEFKIEIGTVGPGGLRVYASLPGEVRMNSDRMAHVVPRVAGVVREVKKRLGDRVRAGEVMAVLESSDLADAKATYLASSRQRELTAIDLERARTIHENTSRMLKVFEQESPEIEKIDAFEKVDLGANRSRLISAYAELAFSTATFNREKRLFDKKISSEAEYLQAESGLQKDRAEFLSVRDDMSFSNRTAFLESQRQHEMAELSVRTAGRRLSALGLSEAVVERLATSEGQGNDLARYEIPAPIEGEVTAKHIVLGEMLEADADAFIIADLSAVWVDIDVYQKDLVLVKRGQRVNVSAGHGIPDAVGTISYLGPLIGEESRTALARVVLSNPEGIWRPGLFVTADVEVNGYEVEIVAPITALQTIEDETHVFVKTTEGFEAREVKVGRRDRGAVEIVSGLAPGDLIVTKGGFVLKAQMSKGEFESGHSH